jgi:hypothetical protein
MNEASPHEHLDQIAQDVGLWPRRQAIGKLEDVTTRMPSRPEARCPIRPGEPCTLCQVGVTGPQDCGLVYLVMGDDELRESLHRQQLAATGRHG